MGEMRRREFVPCAAGCLDPLWAELRLTFLEPIRAVEVLVERVQAMQIAAVFGSAETGNQSPGFAFWEVKIAAVDGSRAVRLGRHRETIRVARLPGVYQMAM